MAPLYCWLMVPRVTSEPCTTPASPLSRMIRLSSTPTLTRRHQVLGSLVGLPRKASRLFMSRWQKMHSALLVRRA